MSFGELGIVVIVAVIFLKPEDIPAVIKKFQQLRLFLKNLKARYYQELNSWSTEVLNTEIAEEINYYLLKIAELQSKYEGDYDLATVRKYYLELLEAKSKITSDNH